MKTTGSEILKLQNKKDFSPYRSKAYSRPVVLLL